MIKYLFVFLFSFICYANVSSNSIVSEDLSNETVYQQPEVGINGKAIINPRYGSHFNIDADSDNIKTYERFKNRNGDLARKEVSTFYYEGDGKLSGIYQRLIPSEDDLKEFINIDLARETAFARTECKNKNNVEKCITVNTNLCKYLEESTVLYDGFYQAVETCSESCGLVNEVFNKIPRRFIDESLYYQRQNLKRMFSDKQRKNLQFDYDIVAISAKKQSSSKTLHSLVNIARTCRIHLSRKSQKILAESLKLSKREKKIQADNLGTQAIGQ